MTESWSRVDLMPYLDDPVELPRPSILRHTDGRATFFLGTRHVLVGPPESGKTMIVLSACVEVLADGGTVVYIDFEDDAAAIVLRLRSLGVDPDALRERFHYVRPEEAAEEGDVSALVEIGADFVCIDGVTEGMAMHGQEPRSEADVANFYAGIATPFASSGAAVVLIDHPPHGGERAIGSQHKGAGIDVVLSLRSKGWRPGTEAWGDLDVLKDRRGGLDWVRHGDRRRLARVHVVPVSEGLRVELVPIRPVGAGESASGEDLTDGLRPALRDVLDPVEKGATTVAEIAKATGLAQTTVRDRLAELSAHGLVDQAEGGRDRQGHKLPSRWSLQRPTTVDGPLKGSGPATVSTNGQKPQVNTATPNNGTATAVLGEPGGEPNDGRSPGSRRPGTVAGNADADGDEEPGWRTLQREAGEEPEADDARALARVRETLGATEGEP